MLVFAIRYYANKRAADLKNTINAMYEIRSQALNYLVPFAQSVNSCHLPEVDFGGMYSVDGLNPAQIWQKNVRDSKMLLDDKEREIVINFGVSLCRCSREQIAEYSDKYISELNEICISYAEKKENKVRIMTTLVISAGVITVLLFF